MATQKSAIIIIPSRLGSVRLPNKPLADINGKPMIIHVLNNAKKADVGRVVVATDSTVIAKIVEQEGGEAIMTSSDLPSGTVRVGHALRQIKEKYDFVVNLQGDMPNIQPSVIRSVIEGIIEEEKADIMTAVYKVDKKHKDIEKTSVVKAVLARTNEVKKIYKALYFSRSLVPFNSDIFYSHIGIYCFRPEALEKFLFLPPSALEIAENLEQLKALENDMSIYTCISNDMPISVDVLDDLENARKIMAWS